MTLSLVIAESALELVPQSLARHPSVRASARREGKRPREILLDNSWHYAAMKGLEDEVRRGRPDLVHFALLEATSVPLYTEGMLAVYVHTAGNRVIRVGGGVRLPRSYHRFAGLMEKLLLEGSIMAGENMLLKVEKLDLKGLIQKIDAERTIGLSTAGSPSTCEGVASRMDGDTCLVVGGFQKGHFSESARALFGESYTVGGRPLESHVVLARILYEYEKTVM
ncbi:conserved hypothetical protein [Cenarchaeum symbiosum A]|uniref:Ribosomal RNA small subunit methyltransferase Nep1 n=1 Tax=Cenarchaeum symbiosum (strain A) TaxID=414004 RepID=A0RYG1_CENSY|nr:conserved hypothetical protein [Cenarchaeum symbiosum A]